MTKKIRSTTIIGVRHKGGVAMAGDGQDPVGDMAFKQKAVNVREFKIAQKNMISAPGSPRGLKGDALGARLPLEWFWELFFARFWTLRNLKN